jgi:hypothetical protein
MLVGDRIDLPILDWDESCDAASDGGCCGSSLCPRSNIVYKDAKEDYKDIRNQRHAALGGKTYRCCWCSQMVKNGTRGMGHVICKKCYPTHHADYQASVQEFLQRSKQVNN